jgi:hypothetical protein
VVLEEPLGLSLLPAALAPLSSVLVSEELVELYCLAHASRSAPVISRHWFGMFSVLLPAVAPLELDGSALVPLGALGEALVSVAVEGSLDDCAQAALASSAAATATAMEFSVMRVSLGE